jgi:Na+/H+ antiporter NhaD/arsenite permease-like protein
VLKNCWAPWLVSVAAITGVFYVIDQRNFLRAPAAVRAKETAHEEWHCDGGANVFFFGAILAAVLLLGPGWREAVMVTAAIASWCTTRREVHQANDFTFHPLKEVAWLFGGIFATMVPALQFLQAHAPSLGLHAPTQFYWLTGLLSGVLDNAPTYLALLAAAFGLFRLDMGNPADMSVFISKHGEYLRAISLGAVFFGAMTYLGNGPNFMIKAIAERAKVATPGFLGYLLRYAAPILVPLLFVIGILCFSRWRILSPAG